MNVPLVVPRDQEFSGVAFVVWNLDRHRPTQAARRPGDPTTLVRSPARAGQILGWAPRFDGLAGTIETAWKWGCPAGEARRGGRRPPERSVSSR
jgi:hypothetical protein